MRADLQAFWQAFPKLACFCPRISKEIFGGFVRFQGVTRVPNLKSLLPNFSPAAAFFRTHLRGHSAAFRRPAPRGVERVRPKTESVFVASGGGRGSSGSIATG